MGSFDRLLSTSQDSFSLMNTIRHLDTIYVDFKNMHLKSYAYGRNFHSFETSDSEALKDFDHDIKISFRFMLTEGG